MCVPTRETESIITTGINLIMTPDSTNSPVSPSLLKKKNLIVMGEDRGWALLAGVPHVEQTDRTSSVLGMGKG